MIPDIEVILNDLTATADNKILAETRIRLEEVISHLINKDFEKLVNILYRIDVSEEKLRTLLNKNDGKNAASLIADLVLERQLQKIISRQQFSRKKDSSDTDESEKW